MEHKEYVANSTANTDDSSEDKETPRKLHPPLVQEILQGFNEWHDQPLNANNNQQVVAFFFLVNYHLM